MDERTTAEALESLYEIRRLQSGITELLHEAVDGVVRMRAADEAWERERKARLDRRDLRDT